ncbi:MAG TPA: NADH:ubiquinone oxidoreductase [Candidatus Acetothermia bacterium]|nr:NADH:ubiquinone oxidoreductase [Candidatus Acetothermia bacterium]
MSQWVFAGLKAGIVTTPYPRREDHAHGITPGRPRGGVVASPEEIASHCPVGALAATGEGITVDRGRCIHCPACRADIPWEETYEWATVPPEAKEAEVERPFRRSLHVLVVDAGDCGACLSEVGQLNNPYYNMHRLGFFITPTPRKADLLLLVGPMTEHMKLAVEKAYAAMPTPKRVMAVGTCAASGGIFGSSFVAGHGANEVGSVDVVVPGCPPPPLAILHGLLLVAGRAQEVVER